MSRAKRSERERLFVCSSPEELARAAAGRLWGIVREREAARAKRRGGADRIAVALSGGRTPRRFLEMLARPPYAGRFPWSRVDFFQVDERWVPADDPRSNRRMIRECLVEGGPLPGRRFHPIDCSLPDPSASAREYGERIRRFFPESTRGIPRFDAVILGLGADGHTASLFPGSPALDETEAWVVPTEGGTPPLPRITLTLPVINNAFRVIVLVGGEEKAQILHRLFHGGDPEELPAGRIFPRQGRLTWLVDAAAASLLPEEESATADEEEAE